ncbi:MAG: efflux transporter outer membrane subunit [bacterium]|nr:efflux transporter outer membrane subunit [bacterium]
MRKLFSISALLLLVGCAVGGHYKTPQVKLPKTFEGSKELTQEPIDIANWWNGFKDPQLTKLVEAAVSNNKTIDGAIARLRQARASRSEALFDLFPTIIGSASYIESRQSDRLFPGIERDQKVYSAGFDATWELDLFGRVRKSVEAARALEGSAEAGLQDTLVSVVSEVSRTYLELRGIQNQLDVARKNANNQAETVKITQALVKGGQSTELDTARAESQYKTTQATIPLLEAEEISAIYRLSILIGEPPATLLVDLSEHKILPSYEGPKSLSNPTELIQRRADVRVAERQLAVETARIGVAKADIFPRVTFIGSLGFEAADFSGLDDRGNDIHSFGPSISWAALDMGRVLARIRSQEGKAAEAAANYEASVLEALRDVEDSFLRFSKERSRFSYLKEAFEKSARASELARAQYQAGLIDFLTVLDSERQLLSSEDALAKSQTTTLTSLVSIYKSLGGGWESYEIKNLEK